MGKSMKAPDKGKYVAFVHNYDQKPKRRLYEVLKSQGLEAGQPVRFLSDGADTVRQLQTWLSPQSEHLMNCPLGPCGPRNSMKMMQSRGEWSRGGEIGETVEKSRLLDCLIRSMQDCANNWALSSSLWKQ